MSRKKKERRALKVERKEQVRRKSSSDMKKFYIVLGAVALVGLASVGYSLLNGALGGGATAPVAVEGLDDPAQLVSLAQGVEHGEPDAPVTILEFADYQCPGCAAFAIQVKPQVDLAYIQTGQARMVFYDFPLTTIHPHAFLAARAARCAGDQDAYWLYHDQLFRNQAAWSRASNAMGPFLEYAVAAGIERQPFEDCLRSDRHADVVTANMRLGEELGVTGTPTVMVSRGRGMASRLDRFDFETIRAAVDEALGR